MQPVMDLVSRVSASDANVLITGERGTGKEMVARAIHNLSPRKERPFIEINCGSLPFNLLETELFGHERGAFTDAKSRKIGLFEESNGGTIFLDEIGELPMEAQARLLRVIQEGEIRRVGSTQSRKVDVRLVAATHRDLQQRVNDGLFRSDLYYRLLVMEIRLPPLRERGDDLLELAEQLLEKSRQRLNRPPMRFSAETLARLRSHSWPGNVRELENVVERAVILADGDRITPHLLAIDSARPSGQDTQTSADASLSLDDYIRRFVRDNEGQMNETEMARNLGISRKTLWEKRQRLGVPRVKQ